MSQGMVIWCDGGFRANKGGWGIHGYLYSDDKPKKPSGNAEHILTKDGYITKADVANKSDIEYTEVTPIHYVDGFGSISNNATNNVAELLATITGLSHANLYDVTTVHVITDSEYVRKGLEFWVDKWKANNWLRQDGIAPANIEYWKKLLLERDKLTQRGVVVKISWVKGHSDVLGNELADKMATIGVMAAIQNKSICEINTKEATNYWKQYNINKHPFLSNRRMYFNTLPEYIRRGEYFLGNHGKEDDLLGKRISDGTFAVVLLKEPNEVLELVRNYQSLLANGNDSIIMARLDQIFKPDVYADLVEYKTFAMEQVTPYRLDLSCLDREPLTRELRPPMLAMRAIEAISDLASKLNKYLNKHDDVVTTDITHILYEITNKIDKKNKDKVITTSKLLPMYNVGFAALELDVNYKSDDGILAAPVILTLGIDLLDRNALKKLEIYNPKVTIISWLEAPGVFRYATVIEANEDVGIWAGCYSNLRIVK
jgi:ribonuclease HI